jgi:hypothetical protein
VCCGGKVRLAGCMSQSVEGFGGRGVDDGVCP